MLFLCSSCFAVISSLLLTFSRSLCSSNACKKRWERLVEWVEKASFARLSKLFEIDATKRAHNVLLSNKNLQALIENPKPFIIRVFSWLAHPSLMPDEHFMLKDLPFYKVAYLTDFHACQARLEEREKKMPGRNTEASSHC